MTRKECLEMAMGCVLQDRASQYGGMEDNFGRIANFWSVYLGMKVYPVDVAMMMALLKVARIRANKGHADSFVDLAGYAACGAECARAEAGMAKVEQKTEARDEVALVFNPGDRVMVHAATERDIWEPATVVDAYSLENGWAYRVKAADGYRRLVMSSDVRPAPKPKAEGVEELVDPFRDAPQTPEAVCKHIVEANPATYGSPHKPTGEELAELAEDAHG